MIYFLAAPELKLVKVGYTCDVERRVKELDYEGIVEQPKKQMELF